MAESINKKDALDLRNLSDTESLGMKIGQMLNPGDTVLLDGDLGAGKTTLTQSIAKGLEVPEEYYITSPSFALMHEYPGRIPLYHMDCYRLSGEDDIEGAGLSEYLAAPVGVCVIEWPDRLGNLRPETFLLVSLTATPGGKRQVVFQWCGSGWAERIDSLITAIEFDQR